MFTLGIFTTHLPYIAIVVFYAFFWVIGVNKASSGEIKFGESKFYTEIQNAEIIVEPIQGKSCDSQNFFNIGFIPPDRNELFTAFQKLKHKGYYLINHWQHKSYTVFFSRPPPIISYA